LLAEQGRVPQHVHCAKAEKECKYWLDRENFDVMEEFAVNMTPRDRREIKRIIFESFEYIEAKWDEFQAKRIP
jgi:hypothetical protein